MTNKNNNIDIQTALKLASELQGKLDSLLNLTGQALEQLPANEQAKVSFVAQDIHGIMKCAKNGDLNQLQKYVSKYADNNKG